MKYASYILARARQRGGWLVQATFNNEPELATGLRSRLSSQTILRVPTVSQSKWIRAADFHHEQPWAAGAVQTTNTSWLAPTGRPKANWIGVRTPD